jgi:hypothetical protein
MVNGLMFSGCAVLALHTVFPMGSIHFRTHRLSPTRAQHGSRHCAPNGQQNGQQDQDEGAEVLHERRLSDRGSVRAAQWKFPLIGVVA